MSWTPLLPKPTPRLPAERKPMRKVNQERRSKRFETAFGSTDRVRWMHEQEWCITCGSAEELQVHHVTSRGAGGGFEQTVALCRACHAELHSGGQRTFERRWGVDLRAEARETEKRWRAWQEKQEGAA